MTTGASAVHNNMLPGFYALNLLTKAFPWSVLLAIFLFTIMRQGRSAWRSDPALRWLVCWTFGGLILMELVPSKRFDRVFPVVPPACLLLAGLARHLPRGRWRGLPVRRLAIACVVVGMAIASTYAGWRVVESFQNDARALVRFGHQVSAEVADRHDQLAVVAARDEGLLLYCQQPRFTSRRDALAAWKFGRLRWMVISDREYKKISAELGPVETLATVPKLDETDSGYRFLRRAQPAGNEGRNSMP
jgi:4-amino-4-deoxy-L-arabinose transferase-like glycosyltransferase